MHNLIKVFFYWIYTCVYASLVLDIFSPSSGGLGAYTLVVYICRKKFSSSESLRMAWSLLVYLSLLESLLSRCS